jgi:hypothetical protein
VALLVTTLWLCLILSELALRLFLFQTFEEADRMDEWGGGLGYHYHQTLGWFPVPNSQTTFADQRTISIAHNRNGFRDPEPSLDDRPGVLFLGDSFVWGYNVEVADRFTEKLRARHPERQVYNFGVAGYSTDQEYLMLQQHFKEYHPHIVFLVFCTENDDAGNCSSTSGGRYYKPYFTVGSKGLTLQGVPVPRSDRVLCLQHPVLTKPYLIRYAVRASRNLLYPPARFKTSPTAAILKALREFVSVQGSVFCVGLTRGDPEIEQFLRSSKIPFVDLSTDLRVKNDVHWSPEGHAFVARKIEDFLVSEKLF